MIADSVDGHNLTSILVDMPKDMMLGSLQLNSLVTEKLLDFLDMGLGNADSRIRTDYQESTVGVKIGAVLKHRKKMVDVIVNPDDLRTWLS